MRTLANVALAIAATVTAFAAGLIALYSIVRIPFPFAVLLAVIALALGIFGVIARRVRRRVKRAARRRAKAQMVSKPLRSRTRQPLVTAALVTFD